MSVPYQLPLWAHPPSEAKWSLDEIKGGVVVQAHPLNKAVTLFGREVMDCSRNADGIDSHFIITSHESKYLFAIANGCFLSLLISFTRKICIASVV